MRQFAERIFRRQEPKDKKPNIENLIERIPSPTDKNVDLKRIEFLIADFKKLSLETGDSKRGDIGSAVDEFNVGLRKFIETTKTRREIWNKYFEDIVSIPGAKKIIIEEAGGVSSDVFNPEELKSVIGTFKTYVNIFDRLDKKDKLAVAKEFIRKMESAVKYTRYNKGTSTWNGIETIRWDDERRSLLKAYDRIKGWYEENKDGNA